MKHSSFLLHLNLLYKHPLRLVRHWSRSDPASHQCCGWSARFAGGSQTESQSPRHPNLKFEFILKPVGASTVTSSFALSSKKLEKTVKDGFNLSIFKGEKISLKLPSVRTVWLILILTSTVGRFTGVIFQHLSESEQLLTDAWSSMIAMSDGSL